MTMTMNPMRAKHPLMGLVVAGHAAEQGQAFMELRHRFSQGRTLQGAPSGQKPCRNSCLKVASFRVVMREQFRMCLNNILETLFKCTGNPGMHLLASAAQQGAVGGVLHERVLERVVNFGRRSAPMHQAGADELFQGIVQAFAWHRCRL